MQIVLVFIGPARFNKSHSRRFTLELLPAEEMAPREVCGTSRVTMTLFLKRQTASNVIFMN